MHNRILCNTNRMHRHLTNDPRCKRCTTDQDETLLHLLRDCPAAKAIWASVGGAADYTSFYTRDLHTWLMQNLRAEGPIFPDTWPTCFALTLWWNWKWRNNLDFGRCNEIPINMGDFLRTRLEGTVNALNNTTLNTADGQAPARQEALIRWLAPIVGCTT